MNAIAPAAQPEVSRAAARSVAHSLPALTLLSAMTAGAFQLAMPPLSLWPLVFILWVPLLRQVQQAAPLIAAYAGAIFGLCGLLAVPLAVLPWGPRLYFGATAINSGLFAALFVLTALGSRRLAAHWRWLAFPAAWTSVHLCADYLLEWPMALSLSLVQPAVELTTIANLVGVAGLEFLIALSSSLLVAAWCGDLRATRVLTAQAALWALLLSWSQTGTIQSSASVPVALVQPAFTFAAEQAAQWSLAARNRLEQSLDALIAQALQDSPALVVTPEGGNELLNRRLQRRTRALSTLLRDRSTRLLLGGRDLTPQGDQYNTVSLFDSTGFVTDARKAHTVMATERNIRSGQATVFSISGIRAGISICFEAIFAEHAYTLARDGAQVVLVLSDDVSFGHSVLESWHADFALLRGVEIGRSVVLLMNRGPAMITDPTGRVRHTARFDGRPAVHQWQMPLADTPTLAARGGRWLFLGLIVCGLIRGWRRVSLPSHRRPRIGGRELLIACSVAPLVLAGNASLLLLLSAARTDRSVAAVWQDAVARYQGTGATHGIAPLFKQSSERSCGAAALSYVLTSFGDLVFEDELLTALPLPAVGYSFADLRTLARQRGFGAQGFQAAAEDLPRRGAPPVIAHLKNGHFVVVLREQDGRLFYFDPALGRTLHIPTRAFLAQWSGFMLQVTTV